MNESMPLNSPSRPIAFSRSITCIRMIAHIALLASLIAGSTFASAQDVDSNANRDLTQDVSLGFDQQVKLGMWTTIHIRNQVSAQKFEITVRDGDDAPVSYRGNLTEVGSGDSKVKQAFCRFGRSFGDAKLKLFDANDEITHEQTIELGEESILPKESTRRMTVVFEPDGDVIGKAILSGTVVAQGEEPPIVISTNNPSEFPSHWFCYQGIETFVLIADDVEKLQQINPAQWDALETWVENGGRLILSVNPKAIDLVSQGGSLQRFCPGSVIGPAEMTSSSQMEAFSNSPEQLLAVGESLPIVELNGISGNIELTQSKTPLIARRGQGAGELVFLSFDLASPQLTEWTSFGGLLKRLTTADAKVEQSDKGTRTSRVTHYGYEDLVGQLRVPLDQYTNVKFVAFTWIAVLIGLYILLIGPGDFFLLKKLLGKMELTWITFSLVSLGFCGLALWTASWTKPNAVQINQLEIIDVDATTGTTRGNVWANLYSPNTERLTIELENENKLGFDIQSAMISWQGLPGNGLGGLNSKSRTNLVRQSYVNEIEINDSKISSKMTEVPIQVSSSKALFGQWWAPTPNVVSNLKESRFNVGLEGTFKNPLNVELRNCRVMYGNWVYITEGRVKVGDIISTKQMTQKNTKAYLTRRAKRNQDDIEERARNVPWDPTLTNIRSIANIMMFYRAAGGSSYTGLTHNYQPQIDLSHQLRLDRAIIVGEISGKLNHGTHLKIGGEDMTDNYDDEITIVRLIVPVKPVSKKTSQ